MAHGVRDDPAASTAVVSCAAHPMLESAVSSIEEAAALMLAFAERTGLVSGRAPRRYLWTDAFAVDNFLALAEATGDASHRELALQLVEQVHGVLGRHRDDDPRSGAWLSGLGERDGALHPTRAGLRIGKPLPERRVDELPDERLEWDRDGQYFHYLTRWMVALDRVFHVTGDRRYATWALELADAAHRGFVRKTPSGNRRMSWKASIDLSRALVSSTGQHDPLDGWITCMQLLASASACVPPCEGPTLDDALADFAALMGGPDEWVTPDALGLGSLLTDALRVERLTDQGAFDGREMQRGLLAAAEAGLRHWVRTAELRHPATHRLAFREIGLAIGLHALDRMHDDTASLRPYLALAPAIETFWLDPAHRETRSWLEHRDIDDVMLATALLA